MPGFFHTLVVFGASASLVGCGAKVTTEGEGSSGPHGGQGGESGAAPTAGGVPGAGGSGGTTGAGGAVGDGGAFSIHTPGAGGAWSMDPRTTAQWSCEGLWSGCQYVSDQVDSVSFFGLTGPCPVDSSRPRSEADCGPGEWFDCARALLEGSAVQVDCACTPMPPDVACDACTLRGSGRVRSGGEACDGRTKLCGCITGILVPA